jgi:mycobactin peptide synthetase MbtE
LVSIKNNVLAVLKNQLYPFDQLIDDLNIQFERNRNPLFDVGFTYLKENELNNNQTHTSLKGIDVTYIESGFNLVKADLWVKVLDNESDYTLSVAYNTKLFTPLYVKNLVGDIKQLLTTAIAHPDHSIDQLIASAVAHEAKLKEEKNTAIKGKNLASLK